MGTINEWSSIVTYQWIINRYIQKTFLIQRSLQIFHEAYALSLFTGIVNTGELHQDSLCLPLSQHNITHKSPSNNNKYLYLTKLLLICTNMTYLCSCMHNPIRKLQQSPNNKTIDPLNSSLRCIWWLMYKKTSSHLDSKSYDLVWVTWVFKDIQGIALVGLQMPSMDQKKNNNNQKLSFPFTTEAC